MQVAEIKDLYATGRRFFSERNAAPALAAVESAIEGCVASGNDQHALMAVGQALKAEILLSSAPGGAEHAAAMLCALKLCEPMLPDDFENAAPVLMNAVRYYLVTGKVDAARDAAATLLHGCDSYYGSHHPRWYQLRRWLDEAGLSD